MPDVVLDNSFLIGLFMPDEDDSHMLKLLDDAKEGTVIHVPDFLLVEFGNIVLGSFRRSRITQAHFDHCRRKIKGLPVRFHPAHSLFFFDAQVDLANQNGLSLYDAIYLHLAVELSAQLATHDRQLRDAATAVGVALYR